MAYTAAQLLELRTALFSPMMVSDEALTAVHEIYAAIMAGQVPVDMQSRLRMDSSEGNKPQIVDGVSVIPLVGMLAPRMNFMMEIFGGTSTEDFLAQVEAAATDSQVKAILIYCDSPGGSAMGNDEVATRLRELRGVKPLASFVKGYCASAAFYIATAAGPVWSTATSVIGSVGSKWVLSERSKQRAADGYTDTVIINESSPLKSMGDAYQPLTAEQKAAFQRFVNSSGDQFIQALALNRGITAEAVKQQFGGGEMFYGADAAKRGMIDAVVPDVNAAIQQLTKTTAKSSGRNTFQMSGQVLGIPVAGASSTQPQPTNQSAAAGGNPQSAILIPKTSQESPTVDKKLKALLYAQGLIQSLEASDEICQAAIDSFFYATRQEVPKENAKIMAALIAQPTQAGAAPNVVAAHQREMAEAQGQPKMTAVELNDFRKQITASAQMLNSRGADITSVMIEAAIDQAISTGVSHESVTSGWVTKLAGKEMPVQKGGLIEDMGTGAERFVQDAAEGYSIRMMMGNSTFRNVGVEAKRNAKPEVQRLTMMPLHIMARQCLAQQNIRIDHTVSNEDAVAMAMRCPNEEHYSIPSVHDVRQDALAANNPGDFPNLLSNLVGKVMDKTIMVSEPTYDLWTGEWPDEMPDLKPAPMIARGNPNTLSRIVNNEELKELPLGEELVSWMQLEEYGNKIGLTPGIIANDEMGWFLESAINMQQAADRTVNYGCISVLYNNENLLDGAAFFDTVTHINDITSGGAPSATLSGTINRKFMAQTGVNGVGYSSARFEVALVHPTWSDSADQTWAPFGAGHQPETKVAAVDTNLNTYRGRIKYAVEPAMQLFDATSTPKWFAFSNPQMRPAIRRAYFKGWGRNGKRERWYEPGRRTIWISFVQRVGIAPANYRFAVRVAGA